MGAYHQVKMKHCGQDNTWRPRALLVLAQVRVAAEDHGGARAAAEEVARISEATRGKNMFLRAEYLYVLAGSTPPPAT